jgi:hypothetical protein
MTEQSLRTGTESLVSSPRSPAATSDDSRRLPSDLRKLVNEVLRAVTRMRGLEAEYVLGLAEVARAARDRRAENEPAIDACAKALGVARQTLQPYALIASRWKPEELRHLLSRRDRHGRPISLSHLLVLARLPPRESARWTESVFEEGIVVHDLRKRVRRSEPEPREGANST